MSLSGAGCGGLDAEAMIAGRLLRLPKHSTVFQLYGALEEAEARIGLARSMARGRGVEEALLAAERLVRGALHLLASGDTGVVEPLLAAAGEAAAALGEPSGWSLAGCSVEEAEAAVAAAKAREAERLVSGLVTEGLLPRPLGEAVSALLAAAADILYRARRRLCGDKMGASSSRALVLATRGN